MGHTKRELQTSNVGTLPGKRRHVPQVGADGRPRVPLPHQGAQHRSHGIQPEEVQNTKHFLGKPPKPKLEHTINAHAGMHHTDRETGGHVQGVTSTQVATSLAQAPLLEENPLAKPPQGKHFETRSRRNRRRATSEARRSNLTKAYMSLVAPSFAKPFPAAEEFRSESRADNRDRARKGLSWTHARLGSYHAHLAHRLRQLVAGRSAIHQSRDVSEDQSSDREEAHGKRRRQGRTGNQRGEMIMISKQTAVKPERPVITHHNGMPSVGHDCGQYECSTFADRQPKGQLPDHVEDEQ
jgi:hypothetical protein